MDRNAFVERINLLCVTELLNNICILKTSIYAKS